MSREKLMWTLTHPKNRNATIACTFIKLFQTMTIKDSLLKSIKDGHELFVRSISDFPEDKLTHQSFPQENHAMWTAGHMVMTYAWWTSFVSKDTAPLPEAFKETFNNKKKPVADRSQYPAMSEVMAELDRQYQFFYKAIEAIPESDYFSAPLAESGGFIKHKIEVITGQIHHVGWHTGQVSSIRRALNLPSLYGM